MEQVGWIFGVTSLAVFLLCILLRRTNTPEYDRRVDEFYRKMFTPVDFAREVGVSSDRVQLRITGALLCRASRCSIWIHPRQRACKGPCWRGHPEDATGPPYLN